MYEHHCYCTDEVSSIYKLAAVEHAALGSTHWASLLDFSDVNIMEFSSDLKVNHRITADSVKAASHYMNLF